MPLGISHGSPRDMASTYLTDGWTWYRFNGLFRRDYGGPTATDASRLSSIFSAKGTRSIVCLVHHTYPWDGNFYNQILGGNTEGVVEAAMSNLDWLEENGLRNAVEIDIGNGPERWLETSYTAYRPTSAAAAASLEALWRELEHQTLKRGFRLVKAEMRHFYIHQTGVTKVVPLDSMTAIRDASYPRWVTETAINVNVTDRSGWLAHVLDSVLWDASRKYIHAPYQSGDPAGYGGMWVDDAACKAVMQARM